MPFDKLRDRIRAQGPDPRSVSLPPPGSLSHTPVIEPVEMPFDKLRDQRFAQGPEVRSGTEGSLK
jgi:hypothetical protein